MGFTSAAEIFCKIIREMIEDCEGSLNMVDDILVHDEDEGKG
ncbi:unnamed protein product, partial [Brachionus calyciflorus]